MTSSSSNWAAPPSAANRVFAMPELLQHIMSNLEVADIFRSQRVNRAFNDIFTIAPSLLRIMGVRKNLQTVAPPDHVETFGPLINGLKSKKLLIRPFEFRRVVTKKSMNMQKMVFYLSTGMAKFAKDWGTIMGYAGRSGKDYPADQSWSKIVIATTTFVLCVVVHVEDGSMNGKYYRSRYKTHPGPFTLGQLFELLRSVRDMSIEEHQKILQDTAIVANIAS
ncbi:uncharacterized protein RCC_02079 [Ramularia collo-cygni]|uniref:F-box domain-containing protein n=1 Tax=Ramularia collo-cygni TaxID=112498 RepID=A0A2D3UVR8_9PEZI|nr:uncharacterized protein RCC_02079 [Ramularia collo-cygni]CZT16237.1 uncharacterized protein RCC_02079 [Ramularia collo-cygni]